MNNKLRQEILKELKSILNEQVDYSDAKSGGSWGTGIVGRGLGTSAGVLGTAALLVGAPVAFGALALGGAAYLAFRTAGWKEVAEDILDGNIVSDDDVAKNLFPTKKYLDLTTMEDATDLADFKSFMAAMKGLKESYEETADLEEYNAFIQSAQKQKGILDKICNTGFVLLNEFGQNDRIYYVKCTKVKAYIPQLVAKESKNKRSKIVEQKNMSVAQPATTPATQSANSAQTATQPVTQAAQQASSIPTAGKCPLVEGLRIPLELYDIGLENEISDETKRFRPPAGELPDIVCPFIEKLCGAGEQPAAQPTTPATETTETGTQYKKSFGCANRDDVAVFQQWLGVKIDCQIGPETMKAAAANDRNIKLEDYYPILGQTQIQNQARFCQNIKTNRVEYEAAIKKLDTKIQIAKCPAIAQQESLKFTDKKKLNEAQELYNKLLKGFNNEQ